MADSYNPNLDVVLMDLGVIIINDKVSLEVSIRSYDKGPAQVQIIKFGFRANGTRYNNPNIGRLPAHVVGELATKLEAAKSFFAEAEEKEKELLKPHVRRKAQPAPAAQPSLDMTKFKKRFLPKRKTG